jgi:predicted nucleic acid-binding protein
MPPYFFDTSALVKRYHVEPGTDNIDKLLSQADDALIISNITIAEFTSAFAKKRREGAIDGKTLRSCLSSFSTDLLADFWIIDLERSQIYKSRDLIIRYGLRTLDGLQLAAALSVSTLKPVFVCSDNRLLDAAVGEGLDVYNPTEA